MATPQHIIDKMQRMRLEGKTISQIAGRLQVGRSTVSDHTKHLVPQIPLREVRRRVTGKRLILRGRLAGKRGTVIRQTEHTDEWRPYLLMDVDGDREWVLQHWTSR